MAEDRFREVLSDLTVVVDRDFLTGYEEEGENLEARAGLPETSEVKPQVIIYTRDSHGDFGTTFISDNVETQLGYSPSEFLENPSLWANLVHPEDSGEALSDHSDLFDTGAFVQEYRILHKNGTYRWVRDELSLIRENGGPQGEILGALTDITERKRIEDALRRSETRYDSLVGSSPMGMVAFDSLGEIVDFNPAVLNILGAPSTRQPDLKDFFYLFPMAEAGIMEAVQECLNSGTSSVGLLQYKSKMNRDIFARVHVIPVTDGDDNVTGANAFLEDISDQKRAEQFIVRSERLKVLGQIAGGVGHNFNNLLQIVAGNANMALTNLELEDHDHLRQNIRQILHSARSATATVRWLQKFGVGELPGALPQKEVFDLGSIVKDAVELCKLWSKAQLERNSIQISYRLDIQKDCFVTGVPDQMTWVALNLLKNSVEAMPEGGQILIRTRVHKDRVLLAIRDTGIGLPPENPNNIVKPFWTTKEGHAGMGLALSVEIVRRQGGTLGVKRAKSIGTIFKLRFPFVADPSEKRRALAQEAAVTRGYRLLFIDDEKPVVSLFEQGLALQGHTVVPAFSGRRGLKLFEQSRFDAVICGLAMAEMSGWAVSKAIFDSCSAKDVVKPPVIILTGCAGTYDEAALKKHPGVDRILQKPVTIDELTEVITGEIGKALSDAAFSGRVDGVDVLEFMQLLILNGKKVVAEIKSRDGIRGLVYVDKGEISHAVCANLEGEEALYRCLTFRGGNFSSQPWIEPERTSITKPAQMLLIEAARRRDESRELARPD